MAPEHFSAWDNLKFTVGGLLALLFPIGLLFFIGSLLL